MATHHGRQQRQCGGVLVVVCLLHRLRHTHAALLEALLDLQPAHLRGGGKWRRLGSQRARVWRDMPTATRTAAEATPLGA